MFIAGDERRDAGYTRFIVSCNMSYARRMDGQLSTNCVVNAGQSERRERRARVLNRTGGDRVRLRPHALRTYVSTEATSLSSGWRP